MTTPPPPPRLHLLQARKADVAVIFRRGPSRRVEVVRWDTARDAFERGHWFHGRIYERRCDLSPDGELLIYFASKQNARTIADREYTYAWTAISRPPWLTALALWPKGDCWHGGGLFLGRRRVLLNHWPAQAVPHPRHRPTSKLRVEPNPAACGEDDPLYSRRLARDGWELVREWEVERVRPYGYCTLTPGERARRHPGLPYRIVMERRLDGFKYREDFRVEGPHGPVPLPPGRLDWVDWDRHGRLVVLHSGTVHAGEVGPDGVGPLRTLADFTGDRPEPREAPPYARSW